MPTANVVYALSDRSNLRAVWSTTVARPSFREISPAAYVDYVRSLIFGGNPDLEETTIQNADLRWEMFPGPTEVLSASGFYKHFDSPIEQYVDGQNINFHNEDSAQLFGLEVEARLGLGRFDEALAPFSAAANFSLIHSSVELANGSTRAIQGQSPYVVNVALGYDAEKTGTQADLLYNVFGRRIEATGSAGTSDVYEEPFHRLDLTVSQKLPRQLRLKLSAINLLNQRAVQRQNDVEILAYRVGVGVIGTLEFSLE
jgi:outer membrane receptor protein involved in Fe transport